MKHLFNLVTVTFLSTIGAYVYAQKPIQQPCEVLLIGTFHFSNPGFDAIKMNKFQVLNQKSQAELELITDKIQKFKPDQFFVEWDYMRQPTLDSLYGYYLDGTYQQYIDATYKGQKRYSAFNEDETFQLAFRAAKKSGLKKVLGIDYPKDLKFDTVAKAIELAGQQQLMSDIQLAMKKSGDETNEKMKKMNLTELILDFNTEVSRNENLGAYFKYFNSAGAKDNFAGATMVSDWYQRNLYMFALVQKLTQAKDRKIAILLGAGHIAVLKEFIEKDSRFKIVELKDVLK